MCVVVVVVGFVVVDLCFYRLDAVSMAKEA